MDRIKYTIIIPVYNADSHIKKCLNSILHQRYNDFEIIIVNDGSTDGTLDILKNYAQRYSNIVILSQKNAGPGAARELALKNASGEYIMFSDADDYWETDFFNGIDKSITEWSPDILEFGYRKVKPSGEIINENQMCFMRLTDKNCVKHYVQQKNTTNYLCNKVFSAKLFKNVEFPHLYAGEDAAVLLQLFSNAESYISIPNIYYNYVMTASSICRSPFNMRKLNILESDNFMYRYLSKKHPNLCETFAFAACARSAVLYCELNLSNIEEKNEIKYSIKQQFNRYRSFIKDHKKASETYSMQRKCIVILFGINPNLCFIFYNFYKFITRCKWQ